MQVDYNAEHEFNADTVLRETGSPIEKWFKDLDDIGGAAKGRKALGEYLLKERKLDAWWVTTLIVEYEKSRGCVEKDGQPKGYSICVTKSVKAPPARVYDLLADTSWWLGGASTGVKEGDAFDDGNQHQGTFRKLTPGKMLRFTWQGPGHQASELVEIKLTPAGDRTSIVLTHDRLPDRPAADGMRGAWASVLDRLKERLA